MPTTPRGAIPYPDENTANDVAQHLQNLAGWAATNAAFYWQGLLADRPAAGVVGRFANTTDDAVFYDNGTTWIQITPGPWKAWNVSHDVTLVDGGGATVTDVSYAWTGTPLFIYRVKPGNEIEFMVSGSISFSGVQRLVGVQIALPVGADSVKYANGMPGTADAMNYEARLLIYPTFLQVFPPAGYGWFGESHDPTDNYSQSQWTIGASPKALRLHHTYATP